MKIPIVNHFLLLGIALIAQWFFSALTALSWHPIFILIAVVILIRTVPIHVWLWEILCIGILLDVLSIQPMGLITSVLILSALIIRILKKLLFHTNTPSTLIIQGIIALISYSTIFFIGSRILEYIHKTQSIDPFVQYFFSYTMIIEILIIIIVLPPIFSLFSKQQKRSSLRYAKRSL